MRCSKCGGELDAEGFCQSCTAGEPEIKVLSPDERDDFHGLTLQQGDDPYKQQEHFQSEGQAGNYEYRSEGPGHRVYVRQVSWGSQSTSLLTKLAIAAVILFLLFVALPIALVIVAVSSVLWWLLRR